MNTFELEDSRGRKLRFDGVLATKASSAESFEDGISRQYSLRIYENVCGGFVVTIEFLTTGNEEASFRWFEQVDEVKDVENFFYVFEVSEYLPSVSKLPEGERDQAKRLTRHLSKSYETTSFQCLDQFNSYLAKRPRPANSVKSPSEKRSWFSSN